MTPGALDLFDQKVAGARASGISAVKVAPNELAALIALARRALKLESALGFMHQRSRLEQVTAIAKLTEQNPDFCAWTPVGVLKVARALGWSPTAKRRSE